AGSIESAQADESFYSPRLLVCGRFANTGCSQFLQQLKAIYVNLSKAISISVNFCVANENWYPLTGI
ncbi:MAG TPA: hypothetical protein DCL61_20720, partial [Cyanobacteria bacterium UBA12227]|nr:hypothetical protein [Cyanobacteria bacterium UBA12227]